MEAPAAFAPLLFLFSGGKLVCSKSYSIFKKSQLHKKQWFNPMTEIKYAGTAPRH